jgi:SAM-dependent methyltransferase
LEASEFKANAIKRVVDFGCGYGALLNYLVSEGFSGEYIGIDLVEESICEAAETFKNRQNTIFLIGSEIDCNAEILYASGVFNVMFIERDRWLEEFVVPKITDFVHKSANVNVNFLKDDPSRPNNHLLYISPKELFTRLNLNGCEYKVKDDYSLWEWTLSIRKAG